MDHLRNHLLAQAGSTRLAEMVAVAEGPNGPQVRFRWIRLDELPSDLQQRLRPFLKSLGEGEPRATFARDAVQDSPSLGLPIWDRENGELRWNGGAVKRLRLLGKPSYQQQVLDEFHRRRWTRQIPNPLADFPERTHQTLKALNRGLRGIRFHAERSSRFLRWSQR